MLNASRSAVVLALCLLVVSPAVASNLVTVDWLQKHRNDRDVLLLDTSPAQVYAAKHIAGAVSVDLYSYGVAEMPKADVERLYQSFGISAGKKIVLYDQGAGMMATKLFHSLVYYGFPVKDLAILDGGLAKWESEKLPVTKDPTTPKSGSFKIKKVNEDIRVRLPEVLAASGDSAHYALVEGLGANWHFGELHVFSKAGHIPNGILMPSADFYNADKTFKSPEEIKRMFAYAGVRPDQAIYTYCGGGVAATVPFFAAKFILDYPNVKVYLESEMGWLADNRDLPFWTYDAPYLMRDAQWLQFWCGDMIRSYVGTKVSIVDVRTADAYKQGHVPYALNVPAEVFKTNLSDPARLASLLGTAGIDPSHEAVIVSSGGLNKDSALAFVVLEKLGQSRVSILKESMDAWTQNGLKVKTDPTVVAPKKGPHDVAIPPVTYATNIQTKSTAGLYPKVFIASGKELPAKALDGKVVHVPYTDLLNADGTPKAAKDIWNVLSKAGVPRYAEIVCVSDDPGEAAANYVILKMMGYPDIKVLR